MQDLNAALPVLILTQSQSESAQRQAQPVAAPVGSQAALGHSLAGHTVVAAAVAEAGHKGRRAGHTVGVVDCPLVWAAGAGAAVGAVGAAAVAAAVAAAAAAEVVQRHTSGRLTGGADMAVVGLDMDLPFCCAQALSFPKRPTQVVAMSQRLGILCGPQTRCTAAAQLLAAAA